MQGVCAALPHGGLVRITTLYKQRASLYKYGTRQGRPHQLRSSHLWFLTSV